MLEKNPCYGGRMYEHSGYNLYTQISLLSIEQLFSLILNIEFFEHYVIGIIVPWLMLISILSLHNELLQLITFAIVCLVLFSFKTNNIKMALTAAQLLDELMGKDRNLVPGETSAQVHWSHPDVSFLTAQPAKTCLKSAK